MFKLRELPFKKEEVVNFLSEKTFEYHYGKHHQTYVNNLNNLIKGTEFEGKNLFEIVMNSQAGVFNNAAQIFNHDFYWDCIAPKSAEMSADLSGAIVASFGSLEQFKEEFVSKATTLFGSGWCWLVLDSNTQKLEIMQTSNAAVPMTEGKIPLLVVDVWEHAYYIDYKNVRPEYLTKFWDYLNWEFASKMFGEAKAKGMESVAEYCSVIHS